METKMYREQIWCLKGLAIISVIYAHCSNRISYNEIDTFLDNIRNNIGTIGVPLFLIISGFLFHNEQPVREFWRKKRGMIAQWLIWGTLIWAYEVIRKGLGYANILEWLAGIGTYLWFMHTIMLLWLIFFYIRNTRLQFVFLVLSIIYHIVTYDLMLKTVVNDNIIANDVMCHMPFFVFGLCLQDKTLQDVCHKIFLKRLKWLRGGCAVVCILLALWANGNKIAYDSPFFLLYIMGSGVCCLAISECLVQYECTKKALCWLGKYSYMIYLTHMPIAGIISNLFSRSKYLLYGVMLYPLIAVAASALCIYILKTICGKFHVLTFLVGVREN